MSTLPRPIPTSTSSTSSTSASAHPVGSTGDDVSQLAFLLTSLSHASPSTHTTPLPAGGSSFSPASPSPLAAGLGARRLSVGGGSAVAGGGVQKARRASTSGGRRRSVLSPSPVPTTPQSLHSPLSSSLPHHASHSPSPPPTQISSSEDATIPTKPGSRRRSGQTFKCESCSKVYRHPQCLVKHRWEHSPHWREASKFLLSKHQQVQLLEAAAILVHISPSSGGTSLPEDKSLWPAAVSPPSAGLLGSDWLHSPRPSPAMLLSQSLPTPGMRMRGASEETGEIDVVGEEDEEYDEDDEDEDDRDHSPESGEWGVADEMEM